MKLEEEILLNKFGQDLIPNTVLVKKFESLSDEKQKEWLHSFLFYILQSKVRDVDIEEAIKNSKLKNTYTPCVLLKKGGVQQSNLKKIINLPVNENFKVFILFIELFKIAYKRRYEIEKNNPNKWWYWDLSDFFVEKKIYKLYSSLSD
ncbi:DUF5958 family protein [Riemerella anatipestifer]|uniref:DUF5958 family protein n=1 Tax=Riemerella anatipestifer TaxID=34085 RepID=UPI0030BE9E8C